MFETDVSSTISFHAFDDPISASVIKMEMTSFTAPMCMRVELYGCSQTTQGMSIFRELNNLP